MISKMKETRWRKCLCGVSLLQTPLSLGQSEIQGSEQGRAEVSRNEILNWIILTQIIYCFTYVSLSSATLREQY